MAETPIISIRDLQCSYSKRVDEPVLNIKHLDLPQGKIIFLLGASGSGKSTLLETLGLMNDTVVAGSISMLVPDGSSLNLPTLWQPGREAELNRVRKDYLSFIFQNTNLMENFTAYENICLSQMIKNDAKLETVIPGARELMKQVGLPESEVGTETLSVHLSGGQRQRVSFVRALNTDFRLLLCDEPTGNLDEVNARELLKIVRDNLGPDKTAILVSHDINLALRYADQIVVITRNKEKGYGEVLPEHIYLREHWSSMPPETFQEFRDGFLQFFGGKEREPRTQKDSEAETENTGKYGKLFIRKEGHSLLGRRKMNFWILTSIITITLIAIGFANGTLAYINNKLNDRFINWLTITLPYLRSDEGIVDEFKERLNADSIRERYRIENVTAFKETNLDFFRSSGQESEFIKGRLLAEDDPLSRDLFGADNLICGDTSFRGANDLGIVVTQRFLDRMGYLEHARPEEVLLVYLNNHDLDTTRLPGSEFRVPVPVRAVIRDIPGKNNFIVTEFFYRSWLTTEECIFDFRNQRKQLNYFVPGDKTIAGNVVKAIRAVSGRFALIEKVPDRKLDSGMGKFDEESESYDDRIEADSDDETSVSDDTELTAPESVAPESSLNFRMDTLGVEIYEPEKYDYLNRPGFLVTVNLTALPEYYVTTERINEAIQSIQTGDSKSGQIVRVFDYNLASESESSINNDYLSVNFKKGGLDSIESFSRALVKMLNSDNTKNQSSSIETDAGNIKEKKNLNYLSKMTLLIATLLVIFSILSICLFISNLLRSHLAKVKMNLGTFKAFGLTDREAVRIYLVIMGRFVLMCVLISFLLAFAIGRGLEMVIGSRFALEDRFRYFQLMDWRTAIVIILLLSVTWIVSQLTVTKILSKSPGDLIYNR